MAREISTPIVLEQSNIVPGSETVRIKGAAIPALIRDADYIINNEKGEIKFLATGAAIEFSTLIEQNGIDVTYSYQLDLTDPDLFESQVEVFDELATRVSDFTFSVANGPISHVSRVLNQTTQEEYTVLSIHDNQVSFTGGLAPRTTSLSNLDTTLDQVAFDPQVPRHINTFSTKYPSQYSPDLNPTITLDSLSSTTKDLFLLVIGGEEELVTTIRVRVPFETTSIQLQTGGRTLRSSSSNLLIGTDFTLLFNIVQGDTKVKEAVITLAPTAIQKIRTNNLYMSLIFAEVITLLEKNQFQTKTNHINQRLSFVSNEVLMTELPRLVNLGDVADQIISPTIQVIDPISKFIFVEGIDYEINLTQQKLKLIPSGRISSEVLIYYIEERRVRASIELVSDIVIIDYVWTSNSLNWSKFRKQVPITQVEDLKKGKQFITLTDAPLDELQVKIFLESDFTKTPVSTPLSINNNTLRLHISPPIPKDDRYVIEYVSVKQPIREGTPYFVSYKYGASRDVVKSRYARLVGIDETQTSREEVQSLAAGTTSAQLSRSPTTLESVLIFLEGDAQEAPVATATSFDNVTRTITFSSLTSSGRYVFRYLTSGFDSKNLRTGVSKIFETFSTGPTLAAFENIISGFVSTPPEITSGLTDRFVLPNKEHTTGNQIAYREFQTSEPLDDGTESIQFVPARFNLGAIIESSKEGFISAPVASNLGLLEGTLEFLAGILFEANDQKLHYFVDVLGKDPRKNRFSLYKSKNNKLNFDIWDNKGQLFRTSTDVTQIYHTEIIELTAGDDTATLSFDATAAQLDLDDNQTPDLYDGLETKFIIMPETPTFPEDFKKASIKVLGYDASTRVVTFEPVDFSGRYVFSYVGGLVKFEETESFIATTWKLHTHDGEAPFYRLYINGRKIIDTTLADIDFSAGGSTQSTYDTSFYDEDVYEDEQ